MPDSVARYFELPASGQAELLNLETAIDAAKWLHVPVGKQLFEIVQDTNLELLRSSQNWLQTRVNAGFQPFEYAANCGF